MLKRTIRVDIIGGPYPKKRKCRIVGNKIVLKEGTKGRGGEAITASFDNTCYVPYFSGIWPFRHIKHKLHWIEGTTKCVSYEPTAEDSPSCTIEDVSHYGEATVIKLAGSLKPPFNLGLIYVLLIVSIIIGIIGIAISTGHLRF